MSYKIKCSSDQCGNNRQTLGVNIPTSIVYQLLMVSIYQISA